MLSSKNATCCGFLACPLPAPSQKALYRKYFSTMKYRSSALQISYSGCGIYCFTSTKWNFLNHLSMFISVIWLFSMQKPVTTSVWIITALNRVYVWVGMWRQRNIGCILFGWTYFPCGFLDDLNDFVSDRSTYICEGDAHPFPLLPPTI